MDFGKVDEKELKKIDFRLPPDTALTKAVLKSGKGDGRPMMYFGCAKWGRKDWVGKIYPPKTKDADFLEHYARHFNTIELNATFYNLPQKHVVKNWKSKVGRDFKFAPKFTNIITHYRRLQNVTEYVDKFFDTMALLDENLGPIFLMPHPSMSPKQLEIILNFIDSLPKDIELFVEVRHPDWFTKENVGFFSLLRDRNVGSVLTDTSGRRDCLHMNLSTPECFIRFVGNSLHPTDYKRIDEWIDRLGKWSDKGIEKVYFYMHQHEELYSPELIRYTIEQLNKKHKQDIPVPKFYGDNQPETLF